MIIIMLLLSLIGLTMLSASMEKHASQLFTSRPSVTMRRYFRALGSGLLALMLLLSSYCQGVGHGMVCVLGCISLAHLIVAMLLCYYPQRLGLLLLLGNKLPPLTQPANKATSCSEGG